MTGIHVASRLRWHNRRSRFRQVLSLVLSVAVAGFTYFQPALLLAQSAERRTYFYLPDHLGSSNIVTDEQGLIVQRFEYQPYGGTSVQPASNARPHQFTGQRRDAETGFYFYQARYYDPGLGRFVSADPLVGAIADPQPLNRYSYALNNPLRYTDPTGHFPFLAFLIPILIKAAIGAATGAAINGAVAVATGGNVTKALITGAVGGAIFGAGGAIAGGSAFSGSTLSAVMARGGVMATAGGLAGLSGAAINQQPLGRGAVIGAALGFAGAVVPAPTVAWLGGGRLGAAVNPHLNQALVGAAVGSALAGVQGLPYAKGAMAGAALYAANSVIGSAFGSSLYPSRTSAEELEGIPRTGQNVLQAAGKSGRSPEFFGGQVSESTFLSATERYLGPGYREASPGRWMSADGTRQVRFGAHETQGSSLHGHFEAYQNGRVIENTRVDITPD